MTIIEKGGAIPPNGLQKNQEEQNYVQKNYK